jgi:hypothetical protein
LETKRKRELRSLQLKFQEKESERENASPDS